MSDTSDLKDALRQFRIEHDARIAATYLTKAEAEKLSNGGASTVYISKTQPNLSLGSWTKEATNPISGHTFQSRANITYNGDGTLSTSTGEIFDNTLFVYGTNEFSGVITASEGTNYAAAKLAFSYYSEQDDRDTPSLEADLENIDDTKVEARIRYDGDGVLSVGNLSEGVFARIDSEDDDFKLSFRALDDDASHLQNITGTLYATETDRYEAAKYDFNLTQ